MNQRAGLISYDGLPVSSGGGHGLGRLRPSPAWTAVQHFMTPCTAASTPSALTVAIHPAPSVDPAVVTHLKESARLMLAVGATPDRHVDSQEYGSSLYWELPVSKVDDAILWLEAAGKQPPHWLGGPAEVSVDYDALRFCAVESHTELPYQGSSHYLEQAYDGYGTLLGESSCRLRLTTNKCSLSLILFLPFEQPDETLWAYVAHLQSHLPMPLSAKHWSNWKLTRKRNAYLKTRIKTVPPISLSGRT